MERIEKIVYLIEFDDGEFVRTDFAWASSFVCDHSDRIDKITRIKIVEIHEEIDLSELLDKI